MSAVLLCSLLSSNEFVDCNIENIRKFPQRFDIRRISPDFVITDKGFSAAETSG